MHKCKLCSRKFSSGKAMGGHMRSHLMTLPLPPKTPPQKLDAAGGRGSESTLSLSSLKDGEMEQLDAQSIPREKMGVMYTAAYREREENPKKGSRTVDPDQFLDVGSSAVVHDRESETESTKNPTRRRSKRIRRMFIAEEPESHDQGLVEIKDEKSGEFEPVSSFSDTSPEEDIAICLMMLSKDVWKSSTSYESSKLRERKEKYQCEICNKVLKSSQALGSHKTIHKNNNEEKNAGKLEERRRQLKFKNNVDDDHPKVHECPFCGKIYGSGQALGGHKRSHILSTSMTGSSSSGKYQNGFIDLNMPAPMEDESFSQQEVSGVS